MDELKRFVERMQISSMFIEGYFSDGIDDWWWDIIAEYYTA